MITLLQYDKISVLFQIHFRQIKMLSSCPCSSDRPYLQCCGLYLSGKEKAPTPEALMRSRYSAFAKQKFAYLTRTMHGRAKEEFDLQSVRRDAPFLKWLKLEVLRTETNEATGLVEFKAYYRFQGIMGVLHELSQFEKVNDEWFYSGRIS